MINRTFHVVVAEDEELLLHNLAQKIYNTNLNFKVVGTALTGNQALNLVKELKPDILITDIKMPVMTGIELLENVHYQFPSIKTVIISGFSDFEYSKSALHYGVCDYLLKPIDNDELYQTLRTIRTSLELEQHTYDEIFNQSVANQSPSQIAQILYEYILQNYNSKINLNLIADNMNYNANSLTKIFNDFYSITPNKFIISLRIQKAQTLLIHNPELSIGQIGESIGYPDAGYFSRIFKKQTGISPFDYREQQNSYRQSP